MKTASAILVIILAILACGCTAAAPAAASPAATAGAPAAAAAIPDLTGNWTGPMQGYDQGTGFSDYRDFKVVMDVTGQHGRIFAGTITFTANGTASSSGFAGAIGRDGKTLTITEEAGGYCTGTVVGENEIELVYMQDGSPYSIAIDSFKRE
jgi:hypothetical protein